MSLRGTGCNCPGDARTASVVTVDWDDDYGRLGSVRFQTPGESPVGLGPREYSITFSSAFLRCVIFLAVRRPLPRAPLGVGSRVFGFSQATLGFPDMSGHLLEARVRVDFLFGSVSSMPWFQQDKRQEC